MRARGARLVFAIRRQPPPGPRPAPARRRHARAGGQPHISWDEFENFHKYALNLPFPNFLMTLQHAFHSFTFIPPLNQKIEMKKSPGITNK